MTAAELAEHLGAKRSGKDWMARCPAHEDSTPSLSISEGREGRVLVKCHAGCSAAAILGALGKTERDLFPNGNGNGHHGSTLGEEVAAYDYCDENGALLFQVVRYRLPKDFRQRRPDGRGGWTWKLGDVRRVLYRLPELLQRSEDALVWVVEGEKDADALAALGLTATTNPQGAGKWRSEYADSLKGADVCVVPDNDQVGRKHAQDVARQLRGVAARVRIVAVPRGKDASEYLELAGTAAELNALADAAPHWSPDTSESVPPPVPGRQPTGDPAPLATGLDCATPRPSPTPPPLRLVHVLAGEPPAPPSLLVERLVLDQDVTLISGKGGDGKSICLLHVAVGVALGRDVFGTLRVSRPGAVLLVCPEDGASWVRMALDAIITGEGLGDRRAELEARLIIVADDEMVSLQRDVGRLAAAAREIGAVLVILDPLRNLIPGIEEKDNDQAGAVVDDLRRRVCRGAGAAVVISHHYRKPGSGAGPERSPTVDDVRGAGAWVAAARLVFGLSKPLASDTITLTSLKSNRLPAKALRHTLRLGIEAETSNAAAWHSCTLSDVDLAGGSESYTPGFARDLTEFEMHALSAVSDDQEPGMRLGHSAWFKRSGITSEDTFDSIKKRFSKLGFVDPIPTGKKTRNGSTEYAFAITDEGRKVLARAQGTP